MNASEDLSQTILHSSPLLSSAVTNPLSTTSTPSLKTTSRKSWRSSARCLTTTTPGSTSAFTSSRQRDTPSSPWTLSRWKNWTARYKLLTHFHILVLVVVPPPAQKAHTHPVFCHRLWISISFTAAETRPAFHWDLETPDFFSLLGFGRVQKE